MAVRPAGHGPEGLQGPTSHVMRLVGEAMAAEGFDTIGPMLADHEALDAARQIVDALGEPAAREFLTVLKMPDDKRLDLIAHLYLRDDGFGIAEMLTDVEEDPDDIVRLRLIGGLSAVLGES